MAAGLTRLLVLPQENGLRIDQFLAGATVLSRRRARALMTEGLVQLNGQPCRIQSRQLRLGDVVDLRQTGEDPAVPLRSRLPLITVLYQDDALLVADKPAGVLSQPAARRAPGELAFDERVLLQLASASGRRPFVRLVHRLDRVTSGVLLFALSPAALKPLAAAWRERRVRRRYLAVVEGVPELERQRIEAPIARTAGGSWRFEVAADGREAVTEVEVTHRGDGFALVDCRLATGRTHQVRVHLAHLGFPVAGDRLYGGGAIAAPRPLLHAVELALPHPTTGDELSVVAPLPSDFAAYSPG